MELSEELKIIKDQYVIRRTKDLIADQLPKKSNQFFLLFYETGIVIFNIFSRKNDSLPAK